MGESHPHGQHEQDPGSARPHHPGAVLPARSVSWLAPDLQRDEVLSVPQLAGQLAQDEKTAGTAHVLCGRNPCLSLCGLHVPHLPGPRLRGPGGGLRPRDGGCGLGTQDGVCQQDQRQDLRHREDELARRVFPHDGRPGLRPGVPPGRQLPPLTATLTWKEFAFIQSGLGWLAMVLLCAHDMFYGWKYLNGPSCGIPSSFQYVLYIPLLTILLKIPLLLPPLSSHLDKIRSGYVRTNLIGSKKNKNNVLSSGEQGQTKFPFHAKSQETVAETV